MVQAVEQQIGALIEPVLTDLGFALVRVRFTGGDNPILQIMAEREDGTLTIEDCQLISRDISTLLDVKDPIGSHYSLEVSSPGIDRPLTRLNDFERYKGFDAKIELRHGTAEGRRRFKGILEGISEGRVLIECDGISNELEFEDIKSAKLILTDALIAASQKSGANEE